MSEHGLVGAAAPDAVIIDVLGLHDREFARGGFRVDELWRRRPDVIWMPHPDHTQMVRDILDSDELWARYDFYPDAFSYGVALRRDGPHAAALRRAPGCALGGELSRLSRSTPTERTVRPGADAGGQTPAARAIYSAGMLRRLLLIAVAITTAVVDAGARRRAPTRPSGSASPIPSAIASSAWCRRPVICWPKGSRRRPLRAKPARAQLTARLASCEARLHEALALAPFEFSTLFLLAEVQSLRGHPADAAATLERAEPLARLPGQKTACWFRLGLERSRLGRYREALASYDQQIALGESRGGRVRQRRRAADGRSAACARPRIAIARRSASTSAPPIGAGASRGWPSATTVWAVALDRDQREVAAREAIGRAVAMDPNGSLLRLAQQPGADFSFIPDGDVYYYIGVAAELAGKTDDALAAFQEYVARQPKSRWAGARARPHRGAGAGAGAAGRPIRAGRRCAPRHRWRAVAVATAVAQRADRGAGDRRRAQAASAAVEATASPTPRRRADTTPCASSSSWSSTRTAPSRGPRRSCPRPSTPAPIGAVCRGRRCRAGWWSPRRRTRSRPARASRCY